MNDFFTDLINSDSGKVSKTKLGIWLEVGLGILKLYGILDPALYQTLATIAGGILGVGVRDIFKK